ncbi:MAG: hypothetical protein J7500_03420 [Sphingomonas sp.]|uniref:hypothetical protein n=1 Tax=Sphingomonas sp. TaxID=28214 RepID=UPI001B2550D1|nr:hypothetical protein [Sphingomonas sp.]MBO9621741.1 hypothetical protein [Sphingomonas sp.]
MSDYVWVSNALTEVSLTGKLETDVWQNNREGARAAERANKRGQPVPPELCPQRIWGDDRAPFFQKLPDLISAQAHWIVSARAAEILRGFDLGQGALYPVREGAYQADNITRAQGDYFTWIFGATKSGLLPAESAGLRPSGVAGRVFKFPWKVADETVAVSHTVLSGPDVWVDPHLFRSLFFSRALGDALDRAKLRRAFRMYRARVL